KFETGYVVALSENFDSTGGNPLSMSFTISAHKLSLGNEKLENEWPI
ncbi:MAG TPA: type VI secretion system tube protein TssD, partial [Flavobacteriales bacterium]|nr:type VI secretion system tube protein TssD [Flavobacteriales bacterium]